MLDMDLVAFRCFKGHHNDHLSCTECTQSEIDERSFTDHCNHMKTLPWQREIKCDSKSHPLPSMNFYY